MTTSLRPENYGDEEQEMTEAETAELEDLGCRRAQAEVAQDLATLGELAHSDFQLVGPLGFVLDREQWLQRQPQRLISSPQRWTGTT